ncbi:hypothetical protein MRX96_010569 [Rhipicephalus microplus]
MATPLAPANEVSVNSPFGHDVAADNPRLQAVTLLIIVGLGTVMVMLLSFMFKGTESVCELRLIICVSREWYACLANNVYLLGRSCGSRSIRPTRQISYGQ